MLWMSLTLILLTGPGGQTIELNPQAVVELRAPRGTDHVAKSVRCLVFTLDGRFVGVEESCARARDLVTKATAR